MKLKLCSLALAYLTLGAGGLIGQGFEPLESGGAKQALSILPAKFRSGVVKLSADGGDPQPGTWYFLAKNAEENGQIYSVSVTDGQISGSKPSLDLRALITHPNVIDWQEVSLDSSEVFAKASEWIASQGKTLGTVSYVLTQDGADASPIWSLWCYAPDGTYLGEIQYLATTGAVVSANHY